MYVVSAQAHNRLGEEKVVVVAVVDHHSGFHPDKCSTLALPMGQTMRVSSSGQSKQLYFAVLRVAGTAITLTGNVSLHRKRQRTASVVGQMVASEMNSSTVSSVQLLKIVLVVCLCLCLL